MSPQLRIPARALVWALVVVAAVVGAGCGGDSDGGGGTSEAEGRWDQGEVAASQLRLGYFPNLTHATALVGVKRGIFARSLGDQTRLETATFNAGPAAIEALLSNALDATYIGPNPAINGFVRSNGEALRIVAGATSGGAFLVVKPGLDRPADLKNQKLATPQLGGTQDVALRTWLADQGLKTDTRGGGDVSILPQENAQTLETFRSGQIAGAWVPEPWATRLVQEGGGKVLVDERDLWPRGQFVTTHLIVRTDFLEEHPATVKRLLSGHVEATGLLNRQADESRQVANDAIAELTGKRMPDQVVLAAWNNLTFTSDPIAASLRKSAEDARQVGLLPEVELEGIYDLSLLNQVLQDAGASPVVAS